MRKRRFLIFAITSSFSGRGGPLPSRGLAFEQALHRVSRAEKGQARFADRPTSRISSCADGHLWAEILERINSGEMPPEEEPRPTVTEIAAVIDELDEKIREGRASRMAARPSVAHYRLSRRVSKHHLRSPWCSIRSCLLCSNADPLAIRTDRSQLTFPRPMERYYRAAEKVVARAFLPK